MTEESSGLTTPGRLSSGQLDAGHAGGHTDLVAQTQIRPYAAGDAERLAVLVRRCLVEVNSRDCMTYLMRKPLPLR